MVAVTRLLTVKLAGEWLLVTRKSGELPISPKLLSTDTPANGSTMPLMAEGTVVGAVAVPIVAPPIVPAVVMPFTVPVGWVGSVTV